MAAISSRTGARLSGWGWFCRRSWMESFRAAISSRTGARLSGRGWFCRRSWTESFRAAISSRTGARLSGRGWFCRRSWTESFRAVISSRTGARLSGRGWFCRRSWIGLLQGGDLVEDGGEALRPGLVLPEILDGLFQAAISTRRGERFTLLGGALSEDLERLPEPAEVGGDGIQVVLQEAKGPGGGGGGVEGAVAGGAVAFRSGAGPGDMDVLGDLLDPSDQVVLQALDGLVHFEQGSEDVPPQVVVAAPLVVTAAARRIHAPVVVHCSLLGSVSESKDRLSRQLLASRLQVVEHQPAIGALERRPDRRVGVGRRQLLQASGRPARSRPTARRRRQGTGRAPGTSGSRRRGSSPNPGSPPPNGFAAGRRPRGSRRPLT